jgi:hypothetical protein
VAQYPEGRGKAPYGWYVAETASGRVEQMLLCDQPLDTWWERLDGLVAAGDILPETFMHLEVDHTPIQEVQ